MKTPVAILGSGNIATDLLIKIQQGSDVLEVKAVVGIDPASDGLARARSFGVDTTHQGVAGFQAMPCYDKCQIVFDATSATAHRANAHALADSEKQLIDLTPAALGPYIVPPINLDHARAHSNINMVSCGGQATVPIVAAVGRVAPVHYAEIVASIASRSAGPGTRANIDEFTVTTARALEVVGGAEHGKAIVVLNPAEPPLMMRDTVFCLTDPADADALVASVEAMVAEVARYVPGYRLKQPVQIDPVGVTEPLHIPDMDRKFEGLKVTVLLEVEGAAHYLPAFAGNLDIMTSAAQRTAEQLVRTGGLTA